MRVNRTTTGVGYGLAGGLVGTILMDLVMMTTFVASGERADLFFTVTGERLGGGVVLGITVHNVIGMTGGFLFSLVVLSFRTLDLTSIRKGLKVGFAAGAISIPLGCVPFAVWLGEPVLDVVAFSIMPHLVWGTVLGWTVAYGLTRPDRPI